MNNRNKKWEKIPMLAALMFALLFLSACNSMVSIAPSTAPITANDSYTKLKATQGNAFGLNILWFLPLMEPNPSQRARDAAIKRGGGNALIEVVEQNTTATLWAVTFHWVTVEGTAVQVDYKGRTVE